MRFGPLVWELACAGLLASSSVLAQQTAPPAPPPGSLIAGTVLDRDSGAPLRDVAVQLMVTGGAANGYYAIDISDAQGRFGFSYLPAGRYSLTARKDGYEGGNYGARTPDGSGTTLVLGNNDRRWGVALRMAKTGVISGTVADTNGEPLRLAQVIVFRQGWWREKKRLELVRSTITDDRGQYRLAFLLAGEYLLEVKPSNRMGSIAKARGAMRQFEPMLSPAFYPNASQAQEAAPVVVSAGKETAGIDFRMSEAKPGELRGRVTLPDNFPGTVVRVSLSCKSAVDDAFGTRLEILVSVADPVYAIAELTPGPYQLAAIAESGGKRYRGVAEVEIRSGEASETAVSLQPGVDLTGSVKIDGGAASKELEVTLVSQDGELRRSESPRAKVRPDSPFVIKDVVPGIWDIDVKPIPEGGYIESMNLGDRDVLTGDMVVTPDTSGRLKIVIGTRGAKVEGDVAASTGGGPIEAAILLAPAGTHSRVLSFFRTASADERGHFAIDGVRPGEYRLYAFREMTPRAYEDPEFLKPFETKGSPVRLERGQTVKLNPVLLDSASEP